MTLSARSLQKTVPTLDGIDHGPLHVTSTITDQRLMTHARNSESRTRESLGRRRGAPLALPDRRATLSIRNIKILGVFEMRLPHV